MYTSLTFVAFAGLLTGQTGAAPTWSPDYWQAQKSARKAGRPLAVFLASGQNGYQQVCRDGKLSPEMQSLLAQKFQCVYLDLSQPEARKLATAFSITSGKGLIISDRTGQVQAFHHEGDLTATDLARVLQRYSDPALTIRTTETNASSRISFYPSSNYIAPASYGPASFGRGC